MRRFLAVIAVLLLALALTACTAYAEDEEDDGVDIEIADIEFSRDGKHLTLITEIINDSESDITVTEIAFPSIKVQDERGHAGTVKNLVFSELDIYVEADDYVSRKFMVDAAGINIRKFSDSAEWTYDVDFSYTVEDEDE